MIQVMSTEVAKRVPMRLKRRFFYNAVFYRGLTVIQARPQNNSTAPVYGSVVKSV